MKRLRIFLVKDKEIINSYKVSVWFVLKMGPFMCRDRMQHPQQRFIPGKSISYPPSMQWESQVGIEAMFDCIDRAANYSVSTVSNSTQLNS